MAEVLIHYFNHVFVILANQVFYDRAPIPAALFTQDSDTLYYAGQDGILAGHIKYWFGHSYYSSMVVAFFAPRTCGITFTNLVPTGRSAYSPL